MNFAKVDRKGGGATNRKGVLIRINTVFKICLTQYYIEQIRLW